MMNFLPLFLLLAFAALALVLPLVRLARAHGKWGIVGARDPVQKVMVASLMGAVGVALVWTLAFAFMAPGPLGVWVLDPIWAWLGLALGVLGMLLVAWAQLQMGASWRIGIPEESPGLVTSGIFAWVRHPIYTGLFAVTAGVVLMSPSPWSVMGGAWLISIIGIQARLEERYLHAVYGDAFTRWATEVGRFFPGVGRSSEQVA